ncbi:MAG: glucosidase, partial [Pseudomonadota bacterium]|nr:glucosidase [Pseudomonadota bacterium]
RMKALLRRALDEAEFLSPYGVRSVSKHHAANPYVFEHRGSRFEIGYVPGDSATQAFGGNSNWRGPVWMPVNMLLIDSLRRFHRYYGDEFLVECPTGSGKMLHLGQVADELSVRLSRLFLRGADGRRPAMGEAREDDPVLFHEYFDGDTGRGLGASHQTGWTALIAVLLDHGAPGGTAP